MLEIKGLGDRFHMKVKEKIRPQGCPQDLSNQVVVSVFWDQGEKV